MSSRPSRRSCSSSNQLNKATIPFLDKKRLVKELTDRGLDASGTQSDLADRLLAFLDGEIVVPAPAAVTPVAAKKTPAKKTPVATPKTPKTPAKNTPKGKKKQPAKGRTVKQEVESEAEDGEVEDAEPVVEEEEVASNASSIPGPVPKRSIKAEPVDEPLEPSEPVQPAGRRSLRKQNKENTTPASKKKEPKRKAVVVKKEPSEEPEPAPEPEDVPSTSEPVGKTPPAPEPEPKLEEAAPAQEKRSRRKSARLQAFEDMEVDEQPTDDDSATDDPVVQEITKKPKKIKKEAVEAEKDPADADLHQSQKLKPKEKKLVRVKEEVDSDGGYGKVERASASSSSDPDYDVSRISKRTKDHSESSDGLIHVEKLEKIKKIRNSTSSAPAPAPPPKPKQADWQLKWAEKMAQHKKPDPKVSIASEKGKIPELKRKESGEKSEVVKKKQPEAFDKITALMSSSIPKKEKVDKKTSLEPLRVSGGSDASLISDFRRASGAGLPLASPQPVKSEREYPMGTFFNPPTITPKTAPPGLVYPPVPGPMGSLIPPPPPPPVTGPAKRRSRFDQPPVNFQDQLYAKANAPPPSLTTAIQISRRSPPPPPPPRRTDDIPPPPPRPSNTSSSTTDLQRRVQELFEVPVTITQRPVKKEVPPPPPPPPPPQSQKRPLVKEEPIREQEENDNDDDDDDGFVIRDTHADNSEPSEPSAKVIKLEPIRAPPPPPPAVSLPKVSQEQPVLSSPIVSDPVAPVAPVYEEVLPGAINKVEEQRKKDAIAEERYRRAIELGGGDDDEEYDPMETTAADENLFVEYQPTNTEGLQEEEDMEDEEMEVEDEDEEEGVDDEEEGDEAIGDEDEDEEEIENDQQAQEVENEQHEEVEEVEEDRPIDLKEMLKKALPLLQSFPTAPETTKDQYAQLEVPTESLLKRQDEEKPEEVYYHGEPVPEVDENELYEIAAGIKPKKKEKKALVQIPEEERLPADVETIELDYYNADIHVKSAEKNIWQIEPFNNDGLALMWGGIRSNFGIQLPFKKTEKDKASKLAFQIEIEAYQSLQHLPTEFMSDGGDARIGFSLASSPLVLGEYPGSWCISASGKRAFNGHFSELGHSFDIGDVVTCIMDLEDGTLSYVINGNPVGAPFDRVPLRGGDMLFPTICTKNANINVNMGQDLADPKWNIPEDRDWMFITEMDRSHLVRTRVAPEAKQDCTVIMTVGLPGVGKTTWVRRYLAEHPHEHWTLISADTVIDAMKVNGVNRLRLPSVKRPDFLRGIIGKSMTRLILLAPRRRKNYILDMSNCIGDKRKRKLMAFEEFNRKCVIFVPDEDTHQKRLIKQEHEENEKVDTDAMMQHKAAMSLPTFETDPCEEIRVLDPPEPFEHLAAERVYKMNQDCRSWLQVPNRRGRGGYHSHGHGGGNHYRGGGGGGGYHNDHHGGGAYQNQYNRPSTSGPPSGGNYQHSPRAMNITHTTFPSNNAPAIPSPLVRLEDLPDVSGPSTSGPPPTTNFSAPPPVELLPPVKITVPTPVVPAQPSPVITGQNNFNTAPPKVEVSQPLSLNTSFPRKSFDAAGPSSAVSSSGSQSASYSNSPRFGFLSKEPITPVGNHSVPPPTIPSRVSATQPSPRVVPIGMPPIHLPPPAFPFDVTVPPPNFSAPPPPIPGMMNQQLLMQQMSVPPPPAPNQFQYPPPQFAPR